MQVHACGLCGRVTHVRLHRSQNRTWAFLIAALILYIPANLFPMVTFHNIGSDTPNTIMQGVITLFKTGMAGIAILVFTASIVIPVFKIAGLMILLCTAQFGSGRYVRSHMRLYRFIERIGRWSMLDVFVISVMLTLLNFAPFVTMTVNTGTTAFGAVVVLTTAAAVTFDPRVIWDALETKHAGRAIQDK